MNIIARTVRGLEWVAAAEIATVWPNRTDLDMAAREVRFTVDHLDRAITGLRTVDDVFVEVASIGRVGNTKSDLPALASRLARLDWQAQLRQLADIRTIPRTPRFDVVASLEGRRTYNRFDVENTVGAAIEAGIRGSHLRRTRDSARPMDPDVTVRLYLRESYAKAAIRVDRRPLHRRVYKQDTAPGTLHPPVAAALSRLADPQPKDEVADPFCGDGTIAIETALLGSGARVHGSDIDPTRVDNARRNAKRAGVDIDLAVADAGRLGWAPGTVNAVVTNPPWNVSVTRAGRLDGSLRPFWKQVEAALPRDGRVCLVADADLGVSTYLRRLRFHVVLASQIRLAGRVSEVILAAPEACETPRVPDELVRWRTRALATGLITDAGW